MDVATAEKTLADLQTKRAALASRIEQISIERRMVGYEAHAENDPKAKAKLDKLNTEFATIAGTAESVDGAIAEAHARLAQAQQAEAVAAAKANAVELRKAVQDFRECATDLDAMLADVVECSAAMKTAVARIHALGSPFPSHEQVHALGKFCMLTALQQTIWHRHFEVIAPRERRSFAALVDQWAASIESNHVAPLIGEQQDKETADAA